MKPTRTILAGLLALCVIATQGVTVGVANTTPTPPHQTHATRSSSKASIAPGTHTAARPRITPPSPADTSPGSYQVTACNDAPGAVNNSWIPSTTSLSEPDPYTEHENCPDRTSGPSDEEGGLSTTDTLGLANGAEPGTSAGWTFTAAENTTIGDITYERYIGHRFDPYNDWAPALRADGTIIPGESCLDTTENGETCAVGGTPGEDTPPTTITGLKAHELTIGILCQAPTGLECVTGATEHKVWAAVYGAKVTISDPTPPTLGTPTGPLWQPGTHDGYHQGAENVTISAQDIGGGVQSIILSADGHPIETYNAQCDFTLAQPCPLSSGAQTLTLSTTELSDGTHTITLTAKDAAGNQTVTSEQILVDNNPPSPPTDLKVVPTQVGGSTFTVSWTDPVGELAPIVTATYQICPASGSGACSTPATAPPEGPTRVTVPGPGSWKLAVWLTNAAGNSNPAHAADATLVVVTPLAAGSGSSSGGQGPGTGSGGGIPGGGSGGQGEVSTPKKATIHITEVLYGQELVVHISGPPTGTVRVSYTGRYKDRKIASGKKTFTLKHGHLTATFRLTARAARHAMIQLSAQLDHAITVTSTLRRAARRRLRTRRLTRRRR